MNSVFDWTPTKQWELEAFAKHGKSASEAAAHFGVTRNAVLGRAHRTGVSFRNPPSSRSWSEDRREAKSEQMRSLHAGGRMRWSIDRKIRLEALSLWCVGYSMQRAARAAGVSKKSIVNWRKDADLVADAQRVADQIKAGIEAKRQAVVDARKERVALAEDINAPILAGLDAFNPRMADMCRRYMAGETLQSIGDSYDLTRERVRQIIVQARALGIVIDQGKEPKAPKAPRPYVISDAERHRRQEFARSLWERRVAAAGPR